LYVSSSLGEAHFRTMNTTATVITEIYYHKRQCAVNVDFRRREFRVCWPGNWVDLPDLTDFPRRAEEDGAVVEPVAHSRAVDNLWATSDVLAFGANSHIRLLDQCSDGLPVCKVACDDRQKAILKAEFAVLQHLGRTRPDAQVVRTHPGPFEDEDGIFGYRMELLTALSIEDVVCRYAEILSAVKGIHAAGVVHYDISPTNIMLDQRNRVVLVDFGQAGYEGQPIPQDLPRPIRYGEATSYSSLDDLKVLEQLKEEV
jgi:hypothetical protein